MGEEGEGRVRYGRAQKFRLSARGSEAAAAYALMVEGARSGVGRAAFDAARGAWSSPRGLLPEDGLYLAEFGGREQSLQEVSRNLEACGTTPREVKAAVERLLECGMMEAVPAAVAPPPPARW